MTPIQFRAATYKKLNLTSLAAYEPIKRRLRWLAFFFKKKKIAAEQDLLDKETAIKIVKRVYGFHI